MDRVLKMGNYKLPMDLVIEILARLPVKSLMRFKCVCKFFYDLIKSDNQFKDKHYGISKAKSDCVLLDTGGADVREYFFVHRESESNEIGCTYLDIPKRPIHWIKCCQGMLCMISSKMDRIQLVDVDYLVYDILIWNPSTRKVKALPSITFPNKLPNGTLVTTEFGFGISNDMTWKVVMLLEIGGLGEGERKFDQITMVYSQVHGDSWSLRQINSVPFVPPVQGGANDFYLKGRTLGIWNVGSQLLVLPDQNKWAIVRRADRSLSGDAPSSMSEPFRNWLRMGATIPARIQPGSIDHVPFPTVVPCLGASLALREKARRRKKSFSSRPGHTPVCPQKRKSQCILLSRKRRLSV
nr:putative F-box protein At1g19160 [Ipomoea batatas]GMD25816.1 putative F-box protein At1g19160 [Ipomoea batatas]